MAEWVKLCSVGEAPAEGNLAEVEANGVVVCLARVNGTLAAVNNVCPHRQGPLSEGWIEGDAVICPWHAWAFNLETGVADPPERAEIAVYSVRVDGDLVLIHLP